MSDDLVKRARDALDGVTAGPWTVYEGRGHCEDTWLMHGPQGPYIDNIFDCSSVDYEGGGNPPSEEDAEFIRLTRSLVPEMADRIEALEAELEQTRETIRAFLAALTPEARDD